MRISDWSSDVCSSDLLGTNHLGHFALTGRLLPVLLAAGQPRVITTSSFMHHLGRMRWDDLDWQRGYRKWEAYGQSKLANLLFTFGLDRRARAAGSALVARSEEHTSVLQQLMRI